jgi:DNA-binding FadR family transcriptional regulator
MVFRSQEQRPVNSNHKLISLSLASFDFDYPNIVRGLTVMMNFCRVSNDTTIVSEVFKQITDAIMQGTIKPGDKIPTELELMDEFGVGRNSVREAIKMLCAMGVLEVKRGSGTFVRKEVSPVVFNPLICSLLLDRQTAGDLYELRIMFQTMVLLVVIDKVSERDICDLEQLLAKVQKLCAEKEASSDDLAQMELAFQHMMLRCTYNPLIQRIGKTMIELFPAHLRESVLQERDTDHRINFYQTVIGIIKAKDKSKILSCIETLWPKRKNW